MIIQYKLPMKDSSNNLYSVSVGEGHCVKGKVGPTRWADGAFRAFLFLPGAKGLTYGKMSILVIYCCAKNLPPKLVA